MYNKAYRANVVVCMWVNCLDNGVESLDALDAVLNELGELHLN